MISSGPTVALSGGGGAGEGSSPLRRAAWVVELIRVLQLKKIFAFHFFSLVFGMECSPHPLILVLNLEYTVRETSSVTLKYSLKTNF